MAEVRPETDDLTKLFNDLEDFVRAYRGRQWRRRNVVAADVMLKRIEHAQTGKIDYGP